MYEYASASGGWCGRGLCKWLLPNMEPVEWNMAEEGKHGGPTPRVMRAPRNFLKGGCRTVCVEFSLAWAPSRAVSESRLEEVVCNALGKLVELCVLFRSKGERGRGAGESPRSCTVPSRRRYAVAQRLQAERELGAAAARRLGGSPGLRWPSVLHRPQHPANFVDRPQRQVKCDSADFLRVSASEVESGYLHPLEESEGWWRLKWWTRS